MTASALPPPQASVVPATHQQRHLPSLSVRRDHGATPASASSEQRQESDERPADGSGLEVSAL